MKEYTLKHLKVSSPSAKALSNPPTEPSVQYFKSNVTGDTIRLVRLTNPQGGEYFLDEVGQRLPVYAIDDMIRADILFHAQSWEHKPSVQAEYDAHFSEDDSPFVGYYNNDLAPDIHKAA